MFISFIMNLNIISWNCGGAASKHFHRICKDLCKEYRVDILIILEPRCSGEKASKVIERMGFDSSWRMEAEGFSGGIWVLWNAGRFKIFAIDAMRQCVTVKVSLLNQEFFLSCVYGNPVMRNWELLWTHLQSL